MPVSNAKALIENRVSALRMFHDNMGNGAPKKAELDLSGGIDSAVMACLLVKALGPKNVILVHSRIDTNPVQTARATLLATALGAVYVNIDLTKLYTNLVYDMEDVLEDAVGEETMDDLELLIAQNPTILGSLRSCLRAPIGRGFNRMFGGSARHGTGNQCEDEFLRFFQKGGDGEVDTNPLEMLSKTEVFQLAFQLATDAREDGNEDLADALMDTIHATPSPDLWGTGDAHSDEDELQSWTGVPFTYGRIDDNGNILRLGTIERVSRLLRTRYRNPDGHRFPFNGMAGLADTGLVIENLTCRNILFADNMVGLDMKMDHMVQRAIDEGIFPLEKFSRPEISAFLWAAKRVEKITRHKDNTNITTLGSRSDLLEAGILTDDFGGM